MSHDQRPAKVRMIDGGVLTPQPRSQLEELALPQTASAPQPVRQGAGALLILLYLFAAVAGGALTMALGLGGGLSS